MVKCWTALDPPVTPELGLRTNRNSLSASFTDRHLLSKAALHGHRELLLSRLQRAGRHYFLTRQLQGSHPASNACPEAVRQSFVQFMFLVANRSKSRHVLHCVLASGCLAASGSYVRVSPGLRPNAPCFKSWFKYKTFDGLFVCLKDNCWPQGFFLSPRWSSTCTPVESARTVAPSLVPSTPSWESTRKVRHRYIYFASHLRRQKQPIIWALLPLMNVVLWQLVSTTTCQKVCSNFCVKRREKKRSELLKLLQATSRLSQYTRLARSSSVKCTNFIWHLCAAPRCQRVSSTGCAGTLDSCRRCKSVSNHRFVLGDRCSHLSAEIKRASL